MTLTANIRYDKLSSAFEGFNGYHAETVDQIKTAFRSALKETNKPSIINIAINPSADRKAQVIQILKLSFITYNVKKIKNYSLHFIFLHFQLEFSVQKLCSAIS